MTTPDSPKSTLTNKDWYAIACKIRKKNEELKQETTELQTLIEEQKKHIKVQVIKNQDFQKKIKEDVVKIQQLETEINNSHIRIEEQNEQYQKQKLVIENLTKELKKTQQLTANLERDCSLLQDNYNEIQYQLKQKEKENKELQVRLQRQQRYNAQYKTALDHYLTNNCAPSPEVNGLGITSWSDNNSSSSNSTINDNPEQVNLPSQTFPLFEKIDREIEQIDRNLEENQSEQIQSKPKEDLSLPPLTNNIFANQEIENNQEKKSNKKPRNKSFLKLPKFGK
ncbi:hypothetical protein ACN4EE_13960 [Geminocystis sp. CENA526]|uniref:hypothetical protein n=1 Tax=Geminocystis sp. CENA526 TaxID=1355871 RepID=UPI003D6ECE95